LRDNLTFKTVYFSVVAILANTFTIFYATRRIKKQESYNLFTNWKNLPLNYLPLSLIGIMAFVFLVDPLEQVLPFSNNFKNYFTTLLEIKGYAFFVIVIAMPVLEELLFRGIILRAYLKNYTALKSILLSSFLFGIVHFNLAQLIISFLVGIFIGYLYWQTKSLSLCVVVHVVHNAIFFIGFHFFDTGFSIESAISNTLVYLMLYLVAAVVLTIVILTIYRKSLPSAR